MRDVRHAENELVVAVHLLVNVRVSGESINRLVNAWEATDYANRDGGPADLQALRDAAEDFRHFILGRSLSVFSLPHGKEALNCLEAALHTYIAARKAESDDTPPEAGWPWEREHGLVG